MRRYCLPLGTLALLAAAVGSSPAQPKPVGEADAEALKKANLSPDDGPALVAYLKQRTVSDADQGRIRELIKKFAAEKFEDRLAASEEIEKFGPAAIGPLKEAERSSDAEVAYRAGLVLRRLEKIPHTAVAAAAVRRVVQLKPAGAAAALVAFLPLADGPAQADDIRAALVELAAPGGKAEPALVAALSDPSPVRRSAAYVALTEGGNPKERIRLPEAFPLVRDAVRKDADPEAKFRGLWSLVVTTREKEFVPDLIDLTPGLTHNRLRQVEELLLHVAGQHPPGGRFGRVAEVRAKARDVWMAWWKEKGGAVDLVKFPFTPKVRGFTDVVEFDASFGQGRVLCLGPDMNEVWRLPQPNNVSDARVLPTGRVLIAEQNYFQVSQWDPLTGDKFNPRNTQTQPVVAAPVGDGGVLIVCRGSVAEFDPKGALVFEHVRPTADIQSGVRLPNGDTLFVTVQQQPNTANCFRLDRKGKPVGNPVTLGQIIDAHSMDAFGEDHVLVCEQTQAAEYDLKTGKVVWEYKTDRPVSVQRLVNGNTLVSSLNQNRAVEVLPTGEVVWEYASKDRLKVSRIYHR
jgi:hypothetical protein